MLVIRPMPETIDPEHRGSSFVTSAEVGGVTNLNHHTRPFVYETLTTKALHFSIGSIQSRMDILEPLALNLEYTELMMGFLLFNAQPRTVAMIGLGGGSIAKYCYANLPRTFLRVVEINPHVIALRDDFHVPPDGDRFQVHLGDGAVFVRKPPEQCDVLLLDGFDVDGLPGQLSSLRFYEDCFNALKPGGIMVVNLHFGNSYAKPIERIQQSFFNCFLAVPEREGSNCIVFARKGQSLKIDRLKAKDCPPGFNPGAWSRLMPTFDHILDTQASSE